jgi:RimJ/RimL family protein N-acetyltransferase
VLRFETWTISRHTEPDAEPTTHAIQCAACGEKSLVFDELAPAQLWALKHAGLNPTHRAYREIIARPWQARPTDEARPMQRAPLELVLTGDRLALALPRPDMVTEYHRWETDPGTVLGLGAGQPISFDRFQARFASGCTSTSYSMFEVITTAQSQPVGNVALSVDLEQKTAEYVIVLAPEHRGRGYATEATSLTLTWAFQHAGLRMVWLKVLEPNAAAIAAYARAGFQPAGHLRQAGQWLGEPVDELLMDCLPGDVPHLSYAQPAVGAPPDAREEGTS